MARLESMIDERYRLAQVPQRMITVLRLDRHARGIRMPREYYRAERRDSAALSKSDSFKAPKT